MIARVGQDVAHEVVVNVLAAAALGALAFVGLGGRVEDLYLRLGGAEPASSTVSVLAIDEEALYLWDPSNPEPVVTPRELLAEMVDFLRLAGARVVVVDVLTDTPAEGDEPLRAAVLAHGRVVVAERFSPGAAGDPVPFAPASVLHDVALPAFANLGQEETTLFSGDMLVREVPPVVAVARAALRGPWPQNVVGGFADDDAPVPALSLAAAYLATTGDGPGLAARLAALCGGTPARCSGGLADLGLPASDGALHDPLPIYFRGPPGADGVPTVPAARVLRLLAERALARSLGAEVPVAVPEDLVERVAGRVVLVGRVDDAGRDRFVSPYAFPAVSADVAGVSVHAHLVDRLLAGRHLRRVDGPAVWALGALLAALVLATSRRAGTPHLLAWATVAAMTGALGFLGFHLAPGLVVDTGPLIASLCVATLAVHLYARGKGS